MGHHDLGWWGFWVGLAAIFFSYPLSLFANLTSPTIKNWWSVRSEAAIRNRLEGLTDLLAYKERHYQVITETEEIILKGIIGLGTLVSMGIAWMGILLIGISDLLPVVPRLRILCLAGLTIAINGIAQYWLFSKVNEFLFDRSPTERKFLREWIEEKKKQLAKRTGS